MPEISFFYITLIFTYNHNLKIQSPGAMNNLGSTKKKKIKKNKKRKIKKKNSKRKYIALKNICQGKKDTE